jgi:tetratricopeptide (TPR) repeat protein
LGAIYLYQGHYPDAIPLFQRSVDIYPNLEGYSNLATAYYLQGNFEEAAQAQEKAVEVGGNDALAYVGWGNLADDYYWAPGRRDRAPATYQKAIALARERLSVNPRDADATSLLASFYAMLGQGPTAVQYARHALELRPDNRDIQFNVAKAYAHLGEDQPAVNLLEQAVRNGLPVCLVRDDPTFKTLATNVQFQQLVKKK